MTPGIHGWQIVYFTKPSRNVDKNVINGQFVTPIQLDLSGSVSADIFADLTKIVENNQVVFGDQYTWSSYNATTHKVIYTQSR